MSIDACIKALRDEHDIEVTRAQAKGFHKQYENVKRYATDNDIPVDEALRAAIDQNVKDIKEAKRIAHENALRNREAEDAMVAYIDENWAEDPAMGIDVVFAGGETNRAGVHYSVSTQQGVLTSEYLSMFMSGLEKEGVYEYLKPGLLGSRGKNDSIILEALIEMDRPKAEWDTTVLGKLPDEAKKVAEIILKAQDIALSNANHSGAHINRLSGRGLKRSHDMYKIGKFSKEAYIGFVKDKLDQTKFIVPGENIDEILGNMYTEFASGVHMVRSSGTITTVRNPSTLGNIANSMSHERVLHFKTTADEVAYFEEFGKGSVMDSVFWELSHMAQQTALMDRFGPSAESVRDKVIDRYARSERAKGPEAYKLYSKETDRMVKNTWPFITGEAYVPGSVFGAKASQLVREMNNWQLLGYTAVTAFTDIPFMASEIRYQGGDLFGGTFEAFSGLLKGVNTKQDKEVLAAFGYISEGFQGTSLSRFDINHKDPGLSTKITQLYMKANLLTQWTDRMRETFMMWSGHNLSKYNDYNKMKMELQRVLRQFNIEEDEWNVINQTAPMVSRGRNHITPEGLDDLPDQVFIDYLNKKGKAVSKRSLRNARKDIKQQLQAYFYDRARVAVPEPSNQTRGTATRGTNPGTFEGEMMKFLTHLKMFPLVVGERVLGREAFGRSSDIHRGVSGVAKAMQQPGVAWNMSTLIIMNGMFGYAAMTAKDLLKGKEPRPLSTKSVIAGIMQGGGFGFYGDLLFGDFKSRYGGSPLAALFGPDVGDIATILDLFGRMKAGDPFAAKVAQNIFNNIPFTQVFYTKWAYDYMITYQMMELASPGALRRMEGNLKKNTDQQHFIKPSTVVPKGGGMPNF